MVYKGLSGLTVKNENISYPHKIEANKDIVLYFTNEAFEKANSENKKLLISLDKFLRFWLEFSNNEK